MTAKRTARVFAAVLAGAFAGLAHGGSSLNVVVSVVYSSGPCGAAVTRESVNVFCGPIPLLPPVAVGAGLNSQSVPAGVFTGPTPPFLGKPRGEESGLTGLFGPAITRPEPDEEFSGPALPQVEPPFRKVGVLPASATGDTPLAVYSGGANVSSWRVVSIDNAEHVELTISW